MSLRIEEGPVVDRAPLDWWAPRLTSGRSVGSWIPDAFAHYARILHPAHEWKAEGGEVFTRSVTWKEISAWSGKPLHRASSIHDLVRRADGVSWHRQGTSMPMEGQLVRPCLDRFTEILAEATSTANTIWLLVWHGYGNDGPTYSRSRRRLRWRPRVLVPRRRVADVDRTSAISINPSWDGSGREYFLHPGSLGASLDEHDGKLLSDKLPSFWWPEDRSWFVSTDIDSTSTYVGGDSALIDRLLTDDLLEVLPANLMDPYDGPPSYSPVDA